MREYGEIPYAERRLAEKLARLSEFADLVNHGKEIREDRQNDARDGARKSHAATSASHSSESSEEARG